MKTYLQVRIRNKKIHQIKGDLSCLGHVRTQQEDSHLRTCLQTEREKFLLFKPPSLQYFALPAWAKASSNNENISILNRHEGWAPSPENDLPYQAHPGPTSSQDFQRGHSESPSQLDFKDWIVTFNILLKCDQSVWFFSFHESCKRFIKSFFYD